MAKRSFTTVGRSGYPRASFWKQALGVDYYANGQGGEPANLVEAINNHRTVDVGRYVQRLFTTWRVWEPITEEYARFYDLAKEVSADDDYFALSNQWGVMKYFDIRLPDATSGTFTSTTSGTSYTTGVGATASITFTGTGLKFASFTDNRGGVWRFSLDGGVQTKDVSVWDATGAFKVQDVFSGLELGEHIVVATFVGDDPDHAPTGGTARGWICRDSVTTSNAGRFQKCFFIIGSTTPNCCHDTMVVSWTKDVLATVSHKEFAFASRAESGTTAANNEWIPNHGAASKAAVFDDTSTDRTLKVDDGDDLITSLTDQVTFAVGGEVAVLRQVFQGTNINDNDLMLFDIALICTFGSSGLNIKMDAESLVDLHDPQMYTSMFDSSTSLQSHVLVNGQELDVTDTTGENPVGIIETADVESWNGEVLGVQKSGTDYAKSLCQGMRLKAPGIALKTTNENGFNGNVNYVGDSNRLKVYPTIVNGVAVPAGTMFSWEVDFAIGIVPDAYNALK